MALTGTHRAGASLEARAADERGLLAVMRRDGLLVPFAAYKGSRWTTPGRRRCAIGVIPATADAIPDSWWGGERPRAWRLYQAGKPPRPCHDQGAARLPGHFVTSASG